MNIDTPKKGVVWPWQKRSDADPISDGESHHVPFLGFLPSSLRGHFVASAGEFVGTFLFLFFALSATQVANTTDTDAAQTTASTTQNTLFIALAFGFSLAVNAWVFFRISGGLFNPAVTLAMCLVGSLPWTRGAVLFIAQMAGALASAGVVSALFPGDLACQTSLGGGASVVQGLFIEMFLTAQLVFTIFMLAAEKHKATFIAPIGIGLSLFIAELTGVHFTGGSVNPARSFAPAAVNHNFHEYHWIYWVGPILGSLVSAGFYKFIKILEYATVNPAQDLDGNQTFDPEKDANGRASMDPTMTSSSMDIDHAQSGVRATPSLSPIATRAGNGRPT